MRKNGFTLIELLVVVAIIAALAVSVFPILTNQVKKAKDAKAIAVLGAINTTLAHARTSIDGDAPSVSSFCNIYRGGVVAAFNDASITTTSNGINPASLKLINDNYAALQALSGSSETTTQLGKSDIYYILGSHNKPGCLYTVASNIKSTKNGLSIKCGSYDGATNAFFYYTTNNNGHIGFGYMNNAGTAPTIENNGLISNLATSAKNSSDKNWNEQL